MWTETSLWVLVLITERRGPTGEPLLRASLPGLLEAQQEAAGSQAAVLPGSAVVSSPWGQWPSPAHGPTRSHLSVLELEHLEGGSILGCSQGASREPLPAASPLALDSWRPRARALVSSGKGQSRPPVVPLRHGCP